jgi:cholesterol transport system auxiliary component
VKRLLAMWLLSISLAGCAQGFLDSHADAPQVYRLAAAPPASGGEPLPAALSVARPRAALSLDTTRIAVVRGGSAFDYFAGVRWSEPAPQMLQQMLVEALVADGCFATTVAAPSRVPAEYLLDVELREFAAFYTAAGAPPQVRVQWQVTLVDQRAGKRAASFLAEATAIAAANRRDAVVAAFQQASQSAVTDTVARVRAASAGLIR